MKSVAIDSSGLLFRHRWLIWWIYVVLWTTALVVPIPGDAFLEEVHVLRFSLKFLLAKSLHGMAYGVMTMLGGRLLVPVRYRWIVMFFLMFHAAATEFIQLHLSYRSGLVMDVLIDHIGVGVGAALSWRYWTAIWADEPQRAARDLAEDDTVSDKIMDRSRASRIR